MTSSSSSSSSPLSSILIPYKFTHLFDHKVSSAFSVLSLSLCYYSQFRYILGDGMSTVCCLTMPSNQQSITSPICLLNSNETREEQRKEIKVKEEENYSIILNHYSPPMVRPNYLPMPPRSVQQQQQQQQLPPAQLLFVAEESEMLDAEHQNENDKLLLPRSTRSLKRRMSLLEKSRDWVNDYSRTVRSHSCFSFLGTTFDDSPSTSS